VSARYHEELRSVAVRLLTEALVFDERGEPCGVVASAADTASHYGNVWTRDNVAPMLHFLRHDPPKVARFLEALLRRQSQSRRTAGLIPIGFAPRSERIDYGGEEAIGAIHSVDSTLWFLVLLGLYVETTGDVAWLRQHRAGFKAALDLVLAPRFDPLPLVAAPESTTEIDRPSGLHGYPLQLQVLAALALRWGARLLGRLGRRAEEAQFCRAEAEAIGSWVNRWYWLDRATLAERLALGTESHGPGNPNPFNLDYARLGGQTAVLRETGYLAGTLRAGHIDGRFWSFANCLAAASGILPEARAAAVVKTVRANRHQLLGRMPLAVCWPHLDGVEYEIVMNSDPRGRPGHFHNGAHWPNILWILTAAALGAGDAALAREALDLAAAGLPPHWAEYYDRRGVPGNGTRLRQSWSIAGFLVARDALAAPDDRPYWQIRLQPAGGW